MTAPISVDKDASKDQASELSNKRSRERRQKFCEGYIYVSTVGWVCRREKERRDKEDTDE